MIKEEIKKRIKEYRQQIIDTLAELVTIPTSNPPGSYYQQCVDYLSSKLKEFEIDNEIINIPHGDNPRFLILGAYGKGKKSIHFHGHYDVVPADSSNQFKPYLEADRLYGRGSSDMKSGLVVMLFALCLIKELNIKLSGLVPTVHISEKTVRYGQMSRAGNRWLRWVYVEAAHIARRKSLRFSKWFSSIYCGSLKVKRPATR